MLWDPTTPELKTLSLARFEGKRNRKTTPEDQRAFEKRVEKRRAKKKAAKKQRRKG